MLRSEAMRTEDLRLDARYFDRKIHSIACRVAWTCLWSMRRRFKRNLFQAEQGSSNADGFIQHDPAVFHERGARCTERTFIHDPLLHTHGRSDTLGRRPSVSVPRFKTGLLLPRTRLELQTRGRPEQTINLYGLSNDCSFVQTRRCLQPPNFVSLKNTCKPNHDEQKHKSYLLAGVSPAP